MKLRYPSTRQAREQGSALLPVAAAMLILMLCGVALSEVFGAQRMQSMLNVEASRASWIAEAGLWHAAHEESELTTPVPFAGGSYSVSKQAATYTSTGVMHQSSSQVMREMGQTEGPLDAEASAATAEESSSKRFELDLVSIYAEDIVLESFELSCDANDYSIKRLKLDGSEIWKEDSGRDVPTGLTTLNKGSTSARTVEAYDSPELEFQSNNKLYNTVDYTLTLHFTNGSQSTISFSVDWDD